MVEWFDTLRFFRFFGIAAALVSIVGVVIPWLAYEGREGEKYSFLNHYISELGERGVSRRAWVFNLCIILSGAALIGATISLGLYLPGFWAKLGMLFGVVTGVGMIMVGVFPMDNVKPHATAAVTFFRGGLLMVLAFSVAIFFPPESGEAIPRLMGLVGLFPIVAFSTFMSLLWDYRDHVDEAFSPEASQRPRFSRITISEWVVFFSIVLWVLALSLAKV